MRYWTLMAVSLIGGILLINGGLKELMPIEGRVFFILGILFLGVGRRMIQQKLHSQATRFDRIKRFVPAISHFTAIWGTFVSNMILTPQHVRRILR